MTLPRPPISHSTAIPNQPFSTEEVYYLEGNQGHLPLGSGLYIDPVTGEFTNIEPSPYIYCTPQYTNLPVTYPPYGCVTEVNTAGVTDFTEAWYQCESLTDFPCVDSKSVTNFSYSWYGCYGITSFPNLDTSSGENFTYSWAYSGITSFPLLDTSRGVIFEGAWAGCYHLVEFPILDLSNGEDFFYAWYGCTSMEEFPIIDVSSGTNFGEAWYYCESLTSFPVLNVSSGTNFGDTWRDCFNLTSFPALDVSSGTNFYSTWRNCTSLSSFPAGMFDTCLATSFSFAWSNCSLSQQSVDNILVSLDTAGQSGGVVNIDGGTSAAPSLTGWNAVTSLEGKGWTVTVNGVRPTSHTRSKPAFKFPENPEPFSEFTDPETGEVYEWVRQRLEDGTFKADDPETVEDEAWHWVRVK